MDTAKVILLKGDKYKKPESTEHIIKFPGGSISVMRTSNNEYWAHIEVNHKQGNLTETVRESANGLIIDSRLDYDYQKIPKDLTCLPTANEDILTIPETNNLNHIAVRIKVK